MPLPDHVFLEGEFIALVFSSVVIPAGTYSFLYTRKSISRLSVICFALLLVGLAGLDVFLLQMLADLSKQTPGTLDNLVFASGISLALYGLPAVFGGIGVNLLSHTLIDHLHRAESQFDRSARKSLRG